MVVANAIKMVEENKRIFFVGGIKSYNFNKIMDVDNLYTGNYKNIKDSTLFPEAKVQLLNKKPNTPFFTVFFNINLPFNK